MKETKYLSSKSEDIEIAAGILKEGGTVVFPTETVYGLGADALDSKAAEKIFAAKGRPSDNPLIVHIADADALQNLVAEIPEQAKILIDKFWPGPLTLIFKKSDKVPYEVTGGLETVAVRMPGNKIALELIKKSGLSVAAPSANISGSPSPTNFKHVKVDMNGRVDAIIDGGSCDVGVESTVLDLSGDIPVLYRPGYVTYEDLKELIGDVEVVTEAKKNEAPKSPGLKYKHYSPKAEVCILHGTFEQVKEYADVLCKNKRIGMLVFDEFPEINDELITYSLGSSRNPSDAAQRLFDGLRSLDLNGSEIILAPEIPDAGLWRAVKNRLYRAAGEEIIDLTNTFDIKKFLFVCTGNTCRSPMAEGLMKAIAGCKAVVSSAGIFAAEGAAASDNAVAAMAEKGIDISGHLSGQITPEMAENADLILTMTVAHKQSLIFAMPQFADKIKTVAQWSGEDADITDPFGGDIECYRECRNQIEELLVKGWRSEK